MRAWDWILIALCGAWLLLLVWIGHPDNDLLRALWSQTMAAWVQAIGSVGAIWIAGWAVWRQERQRTVDDQIDRLRQRGDQLEALTALSGGLVSLIGEVRLTMEYFEDVYQAAAFEGLAKAIAAVPVHESRDSDVATALIALQRDAPYLADHLTVLLRDRLDRGEDLHGFIAFHPDDEGYLRSSMAVVVGAHETLMARLDRVNQKMAGLGGR